MTAFTTKGFFQNHQSGVENFDDKQIFVSSNSIIKDTSEFINNDSEKFRIDKKSIYFSFDYFKNRIYSSEDLISTSNLLNDSFEKYLEDYGNKKLLNLLIDDDFEPGYKSKAFDLIEQYLTQNTQVTKDWINKFYLENSDNPHILLGILNLLKDFPYNLVYPQAQTIAIASFCHKDITVKEMAVRCFEKWEDLNSIELLRNFETNVDWIEEYLLQVIDDLSK